MFEARMDRSLVDMPIGAAHRMAHRIPSVAIVGPAGESDRIYAFQSAGGLKN